MSDYRERSKMLKKVQSLDFTLHEAALFLDINRHDKKALKYFNHCLPLAMEARRNFEERYGPLQNTSGENSECWKWVEGPWPWEFMGERGEY